ncbi:MAG: tyrosine-type recombinase/integrase [Candidatus Lokiarchaeota archaeon]|nr:tyrosine-type recombinase/integrase [Candidatus Lokiarchaeota archaeon]
MTTESKVRFETNIGKSDFSFDIGQSDFKIIVNYLTEKRKISDRVHANHKSCILNALNYIQKPLKSISMLDLKRYFERKIDPKDIKAISKNTYRSYLKSFFDYVVAFFLDKDIEFRNPVPNSRIYKFTQRTHDIKKRGLERNQIFSKRELRELLKKAKKKRYKDFILFGLLTMCGMRINEALTIKVRDINLHERYLETGFERGARKTTLTTSKSLMFFITATFKSYLLKYLNLLGKVYWLFPGQGKSNYKMISFRNYGEAHYKSKYFKFHSFRKSLITHRINMGCPLYISEILMNHVPSSTQGKSYIKKSIKTKRRDFDKWFPYKGFEFF